MRSTKKLNVVSVRVSSVQLEIIDKLAEKCGLSRAEVIRASLVSGMVKLAEEWGLLVTIVTKK